MMITLDNLKRSMFRPDFFTECTDGKVTVEEAYNRKKANTLKQVTLKTTGTLTRLSHEYLAQSNGIFRGNKKGGGLINGDGTFIVTKDGRQCMVVLEMKSSYDPKALAQIIVTRTKFKAMLMTMASYYDEPLEEIGIIVSYPIVTNRYESADSFRIAQQKGDMAESNRDCELAKYDYLLEKEGEVTINIGDFMQLGALDINEDLRKKLKIKHINIPIGQSSANVDLDSLFM